MKKTHSESENTIKNQQRLSDLQMMLDGNYIVGSIIGKGAFGTIYHLTSPKDKCAIYAAKYENNKKKNSLNKENSILQKLNGEIGFPTTKEYIIKDEKEILIMNYLGPNLQMKYGECGRKFSLKTILLIVYQAIERLETLHSHGFIHRDIKPENFVMGHIESEKKLIHLIDFGLSCTYLDSKEKHIPFKKYPHIAGTLYYLTIYGHLGIQATRRDDFIKPWVHACTSFQRPIALAQY